MKAITVGPFRFSPTLWPTLAALVFVTLTIWLGQWQTRRGDEKQAIQDRLDGLAHAPAISLPSKIVVAEEFVQRRVEVHGEYLNEKTIFIDNRVYRGRPGYHVITPLRIKGGDALVAVNRGWVVADPKRENLPRVPGPVGVQTVQGIAVKPMDRVYELSHENVVGPVKQNLALDRLRIEWGMALQPVVLQQTSATADGFIRNWPRPDAGTDTHRAYALQWYVMAVVGLVLWIALNLRKIRDDE